MIESDGELKYCPFRIKREPDLCIPDTFYENFMPCLKEECNCYESNNLLVKTGYLYEYCYRDTIAYKRRSEVVNE